MLSSNHERYRCSDGTFKYTILILAQMCGMQKTHLGGSGYLFRVWHTHAG